ncbi:MAG TPA: hypothetical protein VMW31_01955 [Devosiaceae bacterium]|nr:hypothetical protein [Devosiaceae bacterium]
MLTTTHVLVAGGVLARPSQRWFQAAAAWTGGLFPDLSVFVMVAVSRAGSAGANLWRRPDGVYWSEPWQTFSAISNSFPLYAALMGLGFALTKAGERAKAWGVAAMLFAGGALLHLGLDFPVHTDDAHVHFWPFSDWRFHSAISYYQRDHYGAAVGTIEMIGGLALAALVFVRFKTWPIRVLAVALALPYFVRFGFLFRWDPLGG